MKRHFNCRLHIEEEKELILFYQKGNSLSKTGNKFGLSLNGARQILIHYNIPIRTVSEAQTGVYNNNKESFFNSLKTKGTCLLWQGSTSGGYGRICYEGKYISTHRLAYILTKGPIPKGKQVLHTCDTPLCCNPDHLFLGTHKDNMEDRNKKGRAKGGCLKGEQNPLNRFTEKQIKTMRQLYSNNTKQKDIAKQFNTTQPVISAIVNRKYWKHI